MSEKRIKDHTRLRQTLMNTAFLSGALTISISATAQTLPGFILEELPPVTAHPIANDINGFGTVVGSSFTDYADRAVIWAPDGTISQLDTTVNNEVNSTAYAVNDLDHVIGRFGGRPVVWIDRQVFSLEFATAVSDINNLGVIAGYTDKLALGSRAAIWQNQQISLLGEPTGFLSTAFAINDQGEVAGGICDPNNCVSTPVVWRGGQITEIGRLPLFEIAHTSAMNELGQIVGYASTGTPSRTRAVIWQDGLIADLGTLGGEASYASDINEQGQIVGYSTVLPGDTLTADNESRPFLWQDGVMYDLSPAINQACSADPKCLAFATGINDAGQIAVWISETNGWYAYKLSIADPAVALAQLPQIAAPLNLVTPDGVQPPTDIPPPSVDADLSVAQSTDVNIAAVGGLLRYQVSVTNKGPALAEGVVLTDELPANMELLSVSSTSCTGITTITCQFGDISPGNSRVVVIAVTPTKSGKLSNTASVSGSSPDPDTGNNQVTLKTRVKR